MHIPNNEGEPERSVLIVEDEYFLAADLALELELRGATTVGPASSVKEGLRILASEAHIDIAVLDVNLRGETVFEVADDLERRGIPFIFVTGYDSAVVPPRFSKIPMFQKPANAALVCAAVLG